MKRMSSDECHSYTTKLLIWVLFYTKVNTFTSNMQEVKNKAISIFSEMIFSEIIE